MGTPERYVRDIVQISRCVHNQSINQSINQSNGIRQIRPNTPGAQFAKSPLHYPRFLANWAPYNWAQDSRAPDNSALDNWQNCKMLILLHRAKFSNQILPEEKRVSCDNFGTQIEQN